MGLDLNVDVYRAGVRSKYSRLNWEAIALISALPVLIVTVSVFNSRPNYHHKFFRILAPAVTLAAGIRLFFLAEEVNELSGKIAALGKQEELALKQILGTEHWKQGKVLSAIAQSQVAEYLPELPLALPQGSPHPAPQPELQSAAHYAGGYQALNYSPGAPQNFSSGHLPSFDLSSLGDPQATQGFDWSQVTRFHHLLVIGPTGGGKTTLIQWIVSSFCTGSDVMVIDPHYKPGEWDGLTVLGKGRNFPQAEDAIGRVRSEMDKRYKKRAEGIEDWKRLVIIIDELPALISSTDQVKDIIPALSQEARKVDIVLIILATGWEVATLGLEGRGSQRNNFTKIELGNFAFEKAKKLKNQALIEQLHTVPRSCLVNEEFAVIPDLSNFRSGNTGDTSGNNGEPLQGNYPESQAIGLESFPVSDFQGQNQADQSLEMETRMVDTLLKKGLSDTDIIKTVLNIKPGRNWESGKIRLAMIKQRIDRPPLEIEDEVEKANIQEQIYKLWQQGLKSPEDVIAQIWGVAPDSSDWAGTLAHYQELVAT
jgi:hypothetical protein